MVELHKMEIWNLQTGMSLIQARYEAQSEVARRKIKQLKPDQQNLREKSQMGIERIKILFDTHTR